MGRAVLRRGDMKQETQERFEISVDVDSQIFSQFSDCIVLFITGRMALTAMLRDDE